MKNLLNRVNKIYLAALLVSFVVIILCIILQIVSRYVFNHPLTWTEEISLFAFCWFTFVGSAVCSWEKSHLEVDYFYNRMGKKMRKYTDIGIMLLVTVLTVFLIVDAVIAIKAQIGITSVALRLPIPLYSLAIFIGFAGMAGFTSYHLVKRFRS